MRWRRAWDRGRKEVEFRSPHPVLQRSKSPPTETAPAQLLDQPSAEATIGRCSWRRVIQVRVPNKRETLRDAPVAGVALGAASVPDGLATRLLAGPPRKELGALPCRRASIGRGGHMRA